MLLVIMASLSAAWPTPAASSSLVSTQTRLAAPDQVLPVRCSAAMAGASAQADQVVVFVEPVVEYGKTLRDLLMLSMVYNVLWSFLFRHTLPVASF